MTNEELDSVMVKIKKWFKKGKPLFGKNRSNGKMRKHPQAYLHDQHSRGISPSGSQGN